MSTRAVITHGSTSLYLPEHLKTNAFWARSSQAMLARKRRCLWLSQDPGWPAIDGRDLWETPCGEINAAWRFTFTNRLSSPSRSLWWPANSGYTESSWTPVPNKVWVTDIAYIRTHEGWLYLAAVLDLFSRQAIGWSMGPRIDRELAISVLLMTVWRRRPEQEVPVHSDLTAMIGRTFCESTYSRPAWADAGIAW